MVATVTTVEESSDPGNSSAWRGFAWSTNRDLKLAIRSKAELGVQLLFYVIVVTLFPLAVGAEPALLRTMGPGVLWVAALLASLLSLPRMFAADSADGSLEQLALSPHPLPALISGKIAAHWISTGLPLALVSPLLGAQFGLTSDEAWLLALGLLLGTPTLSLLGAIGSALTLGLRGGGGLLALLILPLYVPILIFGAGSIEAARAGLGPSAHLSLLAAALLAALVGAPLAAAAAVRIALDGVAMSSITWFKLASPASFFPLAGRLAPWFSVGAAALAVVGLWLGLVIAPTDAQQGDAYRIIFIHVPAAWMSMFIYIVMAFWCAISLTFNTRLAAMLAQALAPTGAMFTVLALVTGAMWGKPAWGTYWAWDARMTSELILLFLYLGYMALRNAIDDPRRADRASAVLALVGAVNVPIIYFSVRWWNTLHQGASVSLTSAPTMAASMLTGMLVMAFAAWFYAIAITLARVQAIIVEREKGARWVGELMPRTR